MQIHLWIDLWIDVWIDLWIDAVSGRTAGYELRGGGGDVVDPPAALTNKMRVVGHIGVEADRTAVYRHGLDLSQFDQVVERLVHRLQ